MRSLAILGSTGSIGTQALDVVRRNADRFKVVGLSAGGTNQDLFVGQVREFLPPLVAIADEDAADDQAPIATTSNRPGSARTTSMAWVPMDPVEPAMATVVTATPPP